MREADLLEVMCHLEAQVCLAKDLHVAGASRKTVSLDEAMYVLVRKLGTLT